MGQACRAALPRAPRGPHRRREKLRRRHGPGDHPHCRPDGARHAGQRQPLQAVAGRASRGTRRAGQNPPRGHLPDARGPALRVGAGQWRPLARPPRRPGVGADKPAHRRRGGQILLMAPNPLQTAWDFLKGRDLQTASAEPPDRKMFTWPDPGALIAPPTVITSGPAQFMLANPQQSMGDGNSAVWACLLALSNAHIEPPLKVYRGDPEAGTAEWLPDSPLQELLQNQIGRAHV